MLLNNTRNLVTITIHEFIWLINFEKKTEKHLSTKQKSDNDG